MVSSPVWMTTRRTRCGYAAFVMLAVALLGFLVAPGRLSDEEQLDELIRRMKDEVTVCFRTPDFLSDAKAHVCGARCGALAGFVAERVADHEREDYREQQGKIRKRVKLRCPPDQPLC